MMQMRNWKTLGLISMGIFWIFTIVAVFMNPWFDISHHTLSKLGKPGMANSPWMFSSGAIIGGAFMIWYGIEISRKNDYRLGILGGGYVILSGVFMALVGVFPDGTKPHDFIALSTFLLFYTGFMLLGLGSRRVFLKCSTISVFIAAIAGLVCPCWRSLGYLEIYGISLVILDMIVYYFE